MQQAATRLTPIAIWKGLSHMHNSKPKAFHRDIKSANILLDRFVSRTFGFAAWFGAGFGERDMS